MAIDASSSSDHGAFLEDAYEHVPVPTTSTQHSLSQAVYERRVEYIKSETIKIKVGTWNVAACKDVEKDVAGWFVKGKGIDKHLGGLGIFDGVNKDDSQVGIESATHQEQRRTKKKSTLPLNDDRVIPNMTDIDLYVLGLQEIVELTSAKEYLTRVYVDPTPMEKWKKALSLDLPTGYKLISEQQLSGLLLLIYASPNIAPTISNVSSVSVGTGFMGYLGNKGAVVTRIVLGETTRLVFVNCHLASGTGPANLDRRCWDAGQILTRTRFEPISRSGILDDMEEGIGEEDFAFWFGDLNFRLEGLPGEDIRRLLMLHTRGEYDDGSKAQRLMDREIGNASLAFRHVDSDDDSSPLPVTKGAAQVLEESDEAHVRDLPDPDDFARDPHEDPMSLQATIDSLLPHDELGLVQKKRKAFHDGWREGPITFLPSYKYDVGSMGMFDSSEKKRSPSWCDRILFRTRRDKVEYDRRLQEGELARLKDEELQARGIDRAADDEEVLFDYDPESDGADAEDLGGYDDTEDVTAGAQPVITKEGYVDDLHLNIYTSHQRVLSSDHKPLDAVFTLRYDAADPDLRAKVQHEVARELDRAENEGRPGVTVVIDHSQEVDDVVFPQPVGRSENLTGDAPPPDGVGGVDFGPVRYLHRKCRALTVANTSRVPAAFSFISRNTVPGDDGWIAPQWLKLDFMESSISDEDGQPVRDMGPELVLEPGDAIGVVLQVYVDNIVHVRALNTGNASLDDVLVLRVVGGRDHFIPIRGSWMQSCFGRTIDELIRIPEGGARAFFSSYRDTRDSAVQPEQTARWAAPRELFKLTDALELLTQRALADRDMIDGAELPMIESGWPFNHNSWLLNDVKIRHRYRSCILEALDTDQQLMNAIPLEAKAVEKLEVVAEVLALFLVGLPDGIITEAMWERLQHGITRRQTPSSEEERTWILDVLSSAPNHNISFVFLTSTLSKIAEEMAAVPGSGLGFAGGSGSTKSSLDHRTSLSLKGRGAFTIQDAATNKRLILDRRWAEILASVVFRLPAAPRERERKAIDDRKRQIMEIFIHGNS